MSVKEKINIILVDDHPLVRQGLKRVFDNTEGMSVCAEASSADDAIRCLSEFSPDVAIVDISLKGGVDGIELVSAIKKRFSGVKILVLSMHDELSYIERAIKSGANGYVSKNDPLEIVNDAIKVILRGDIYMSSDISGKFIKKLINTPENKGEIEKNGNGVYKVLSNREVEVFRYIGMGYATGEIARILNVSVNTVESHRRHIKEKLDISKGGDLLKKAIQWVMKTNQQRDTL